jgi:GGDEF domain-containing protein
MPGTPSDEDGWRIILVSGQIKVNGEAVDGSRELVTSSRIEIADMGLVFLCGADWESRYHELIYRMTITDFETQVHNARYFGEALEREEIRSNRHHVPLSVAVLDFGSSGERTSLREAADRLSAVIHRDWVLARLTEHELGALAPETTEAAVLARIETMFQHSRWPVRGQQPLPRPRIGTATLSPELPASQLVEKARDVSVGNERQSTHP